MTTIKKIETTLVEVPLSVVRDALAIMSQSGREIVKMMVYDGRCIGLDVEAKQGRLLLAAPSADRLDDITPQVILGVIKGNHPISTAHISDHLGIAGANGSLRAKVTRVVALLKQQNAIRYVAGSKTLYEPIEQETSKTPALTRASITESMVLNVIRQKGPVLSQEISTSLGIPMKDTSVRSKVSEVLSALKKRNKIRIARAGKGRGTNQYAAVG